MSDASFKVSSKSAQWFIGKNIFKVFLPDISVWQPSWSCDQHYVDLFLQACIQNLAENGPVVTDKMCK